MPDSDDFQSQSTFLINPPKRKKARPPANVRTAKLTKAVLEYQAIVHPLSQGFATQPTQLLHAEEKQDVAVSQAESAKKRCKTNETSLKENLETALHVEEKKHIKKRKLSEKSCKKEDVQLPAELLRVVEIFQCLNTIHSFIASQRENPCTFESLKSGIESLRKEPFQLADLGMIVALFPAAITIYWAPRSSLEDASLQELKTSAGLQAKLQGRSEKYQLGENDYVLIVEFQDYKPSNGAAPKKIKDEKGKILFGTKYESIVKQAARSASNCASLPKRIAERNKRFRAAVGAFISETKEKGKDPWNTLRELALEAIPTDPGMRRTAEGLIDAPSVFPKQQRLNEFIEFLKTDEVFENQRIVNGFTSSPSKPAIYGELTKPLSPELSRALHDACGIKQLYSHQAEAINEIEAGSHVVVATSTSSGKSLIYQIPVIRALEADRNSRALFIFPTKALAQDQKRSLNNILAFCEHLGTVGVDTYDGDTGLQKGERATIRECCSVIFTNPDMLHVSIAPAHQVWKDFLKNLRYVILDELHYYSNKFGAHCAYVMRRLRRICEHYGNFHVQFISCSATIANPSELFQIFFGVNHVKVVDKDGSPSGQKHHMLWYPPLRRISDARQGRLSFLVEAVNVCKDLVERGIKFICFAKTRRLCEIVMKDLRSELAEGSMPRLANTVMAYRGGYMKEDRREIEGRMFQGKLIGIIATNALELGVDIGSIDVVIHVGFPYTFASYRQQSGRAGRREQESLSLLILDCDSLRDQSFGANPSLLFDSTYETISLDIANPLTMEPHLQCASSEIGLTEDDAASYFSCDETNAVEVARKFLLWDPTYKVFFADRRYSGNPSKWFPLRCFNEDEPFRVIDVTTNKDIEDVEAERAPFTLYEGSVFVHQGRSYHVIDVNIERKYAKVRPAQVDYMTAVRDFSDLDPIATNGVQIIRYEGLPKEGIASYGTIKISTTCFGYFKMNPKTMKVIECVSGMESAPIIRTVEGIWMDVPNEAIMMLRDKSMDVEFAIHAASHAFLAQLPTCVRIPTTGATDIRTDCKSAYAQRPRPMRITIYESLKGGLMGKTFGHVKDLLFNAIEKVSTCPCESGCENCVLRSSCRQMNDGIDKFGALIILRSLVGVLSPDGVVKLENLTLSQQYL